MFLKDRGLCLASAPGTELEKVNEGAHVGRRHKTQTSPGAGLQGAQRRGPRASGRRQGLGGPQRATRRPGSQEEETQDQAGVRGTRRGHRGACVETFTGAG